MIDGIKITPNHGEPLYIPQEKIAFIERANSLYRTTKEETMLLVQTFDGKSYIFPASRVEGITKPTEPLVGEIVLCKREGSNTYEKAVVYNIFACAVTICGSVVYKVRVIFADGTSNDIGIYSIKRTGKRYPAIQEMIAELKKPAPTEDMLAVGDEVVFKPTKEVGIVLQTTEEHRRVTVLLKKGYASWLIEDTEPTGKHYSELSTMLEGLPETGVKGNG